MLNFKKGLKRARKGAGYKTQKDLAAAVHKSLDTVRNWEQGDSKPSLDDFISLCELFGCDADYLLDNLDNRTHDLDFVCRYTGLSPGAIETLHQYAHLQGHEEGYLEIFSNFIIRFYPNLLKRLQDIKAQTERAEALISAFSLYEKSDLEQKMATAELVNACLDKLESSLLRFSKFCNSIPEIMFKSSQTHDDLEEEAILYNLRYTKEHERNDLINGLL